MLLFVRNHGWQWKPLPSPPKREKIGAIEVQDGQVPLAGRIFYGSFKRAYVSTLVCCQRDPQLIMERSGAIEHFHSEEYYNQ
eukprot:8799423-Lingulodinium_polyedra.AAC.1